MMKYDNVRKEYGWWNRGYWVDWFSIIIYVSWKQVVITWRCHDCSTTNSKWNPLVVLRIVIVVVDVDVLGIEERKRKKKTSVLVSVCRTLDIYLESKRKKNWKRIEKKIHLSQQSLLSGKRQKKPLWSLNIKKLVTATELIACTHFSSSPPITRLFVL
jgi:hypothetical protein